MTKISIRYQSAFLTVAIIILAFAIVIGLSINAPSQAADETTATPNADESLATAQRRADEAQSLYWAASARLADKEDDPFTALALALEANKIPNPPEQAVRALEDIAYAPGPRKILAKNPNDPPIFSAHWKADYSPDGEMIVASNEIEHEFYLFETSSGKVIRRFGTQQWTLNAVIFSPDGSKIISSSANTSTGSDSIGAGGELILWDVQSGKQIWNITDGTTTSNFYNPVFSPDGNFVLTNDFSMNELVERSAQTGREIQRFGGKDIYPFIGKSLFSPDGSLILSRLDNDKLILWDTKTGKEIQRFADPDYAYNEAIFTPDGTGILVSGNRGLLKLLDVDTGELQKDFYRSESAAYLGDMVFLEGGKRFLTTTASGDMSLWDVSLGDELKHIRATANILAFSPDRDHFLADDGDLVLWDIEDGRVIRDFVGQSRRIQSIAFSPNGKFIASVSDNQELILWDADSGEMLYQLVKPSRTFVSKNVVFSPDSNLVASTDEEGFITLWDVHTGKVIRRIKESASKVIFSPDGQMLLSAGSNNDLALWDVSSGLEIQRYVYSSSETEWQSIEFSPNGKLLLTIDTNADVILWEAATGKILRHLPKDSITTFSPDGQNFVYQDDNDDLIFANLNSGKMVQRIEHDQFAVKPISLEFYFLNNIVFNRDGKQILVTDFGGELTIFDVATGKPIWHFNTYTYSAIFSPDGHSILTVAPDLSYADGMFFDRDLVLLRIDSPSELIQWTLDNRAVGTLDCNQREYYGITPMCSANEASTGTPPATIPFITSTPSPIITSTPTNLNWTTATPS